MHCQISIFELKMMVKIGVILCHFQILPTISEVQLTLLTVLTVLRVKSAVPLKWQVGFENGMKMTPIFTIIFISKMLSKQISHNWNMVF